MQKLVSPGGTVFLKIAWFSLNQVSLENFGVRVPLRFQMHTHFQFSLDFGILTLELWAIDLSPKPGEGLCLFWHYIGGRSHSLWPSRNSSLGLASGELIDVQFCSPSFLAPRPCPLEKVGFSTVTQNCPAIIPMYLEAVHPWHRFNAHLGTELGWCAVVGENTWASQITLWSYFSRSLFPHFQSRGNNRYLTGLLWNINKTKFRKEPSTMSDI